MEFEGSLPPVQEPVICVCLCHIDPIPVGAKYSAPVQTCPGAHSASYTMGTGCLCQGKAAGEWRQSLSPSSAKVKERVELYIYFLFVPSWSVIGRTLPLSLSIQTSPIQSMSPEKYFLKIHLYIFSHLRLGPPGGLLPWNLQSKTLYTPFLSPYMLHALPILFFCIWLPE